MGGARGGLMKLVDALLPARLHAEPDARHASRMLVSAVLLAVPISWATGATFWFAGLPLSAMLTLGYGPFVAASLVVLRIAGNVSLAMHTALAMTALLFLGTALLQTPIDLGQIFWLAVLPLAAMFGLGRRAGLWWTAVSLVLGGALLAAEPLGWSIGQVARDPLWPLVARLASFIIAIAGLALLFDAARRRALEEVEAARALAERASESKSQFLANVSHELRTPMNAVVGLTDVLLTGELSAAQREQLEIVERSGRAMISLIGDLLDLSKIEAGRLSLEAAPFDLVHLVTDIGALFQPSAIAKGLTFELEIAKDVPRWVSGDQLRVRQVLANLAGNAVKFTDAGKVSIGAASAEGGVVVTVRDTGIGIPRELQARLFQKFFQVDPSHTRRFGGTGLGLAIAREIVEAMGGSIAVESEAGRGTTMRVHLPLTPAEAPKEITPRESAPRPRIAQPILVVDDNEVNRRVAEILLKRLGAVSELAENGREAVERWAPGKYALILMDVQMPELDGYTAAKHIRQREGAERHTPIVALTASALEDEVRRCRAAGMDDCLTKPVTLDALAAAIARFAIAGGVDLTGSRPESRLSDILSSPGRDGLSS